MVEHEDRRVARTRARLHQALMELIGEKGYDRITVRDLIERADVGRSTFYAHFETKDDLLLASLDRLTADIAVHMDDEPGESETILSSLGIFRHVAEHHRLFRAMIGSRGIDLVQRAALEAFTEMARASIAARGEKAGGLPPDARAAFAAGSLMSFLGWWVDNDMPYSPERMAGMYREFTASV